MASTAGHLVYCTIGIFVLLLKLRVVFCMVQVETTFSITEYVTSFGYQIETYENIQTEDGYLLQMFRIPYGKGVVESLTPRPAVFLMHGLLTSAESWVITGPERGMGFLLADRGYDVWLGNARGSTHCRKHVSLKVEQKEFWQFSWHEIGIYDLPAQLNYIMETTTVTQVSYIGHSQGTTAFFVMASEKVEFNTNINLMTAMAPVAFMAHLPHPAIQVMSLFTQGITFFTNLFGINELVPNNRLINSAGEAACMEKVVIQELCANILFLTTGYDSKQLDRSLVPLIAKTTPAGASTKQLIHYGQEIRSGKFRQFDYGFVCNMAMYGSLQPPIYNLSRITAPMGLYYAKNDWLVSVEDVKMLKTQLTNVVEDYLIPYEYFNHLDFLFAKDVVSLLYTRVFEVMETIITIAK
ncbi:hypothetical protein NQ315_004099 [Exocentrus adspersus]|uniref:Lipase n=1 Tax=Exocentrus adspersus TaxID=1586481 RepID=A0AAV8W6Q0_9CUCU|nr:hypothetical protein NQ315_004099 [Exocentrus adspersus]